MVKTADFINPLSKSRLLWPSRVPFKVTDKLVKKRSLVSKLAAVLGGKDSTFQEKTTKPDDVAFLQYTSGSTGEPKGVVISFSSLWANINVIFEDAIRKLEASGGLPDEISGMSWLPQYHDAGLICAYVLPFAFGMRQHMMSPLTFLERPLLWVELMSRTRSSIGMAPDFAYRLVARKYHEAKRAHGGQNSIPGLYLSCVRGITNAAEPVRSDTKNLFLAAFAESNLPEMYFLAGYGLAESVVGV